MYKLHLILKYLLKRRIAWVSLFAVMLCTMMVLVVISVMGGWLRMFRASFHGLSGDVIVQRLIVGRRVRVAPANRDASPSVDDRVEIPCGAFEFAPGRACLALV